MDSTTTTTAAETITPGSYTAEDESSSSSTTILRRHFSTIGIGNVFIQPPPHPLLQTYLRPQQPSTSSSSSSSPLAATTSTAAIEEEKKLSVDVDIDKGYSLPFDSWEIIGTIKSIPEDFCVREILPKSKFIPGLIDSSTRASLRIAGGDLSARNKNSNTNTNNNNKNDDDDVGGRLQDLTNYTVKQQQQETTKNLPEVVSVTRNEETSLSSNILNRNKMKETGEPTTRTICTTSVNDPPLSSESDKKPIVEKFQTMTPSQVIDEILNRIYSNNHDGDTTNSGKVKVLESLHILYQHAMQRIKKISTGTNSTTPTTTSKILDDSSTKKNEVAAFSRNPSHTSDSDVWIPPLPHSSSVSDGKREIQNSSNVEERQLRGALHRALKVEFPLLKSESVERNQNEEDCGVVDDNNKGIQEGCSKDDQWFRISIDETFDTLIPFLYDPVEDLKSLYLYRNRGIESAKQQQPQPQRQDHKMTTILSNENCTQRKHGKQQHRDAGRGRNPTTSTHSQGIQVIYLRLQPGLQKNDRRSVHHIISQKCRLFETNTISDYPLIIQNDNNDQSTSSPYHDDQPMDTTSVTSTTSATAVTSTTVAVTVKWSKHAMKGSKKRKRVNVEQGLLKKDIISSFEKKQNHDPFPHVLCVLKKYQKEHLTAIQHVTSALRYNRTSSSDIGLAGIKDLQAVTYQYCTIRSTCPSRVLDTNRFLRDKGLELGTENNIFKVDWVLNYGDLEGNHFDIILRNVSRIQVVPSSSSSTTRTTTTCNEVYVPCPKKHIQDMVKRVSTFGFVNFYGEQRLGVPGSSAEVGVRGFDVGRAMLQQNFALAVDLILTGRSKAGHHVEGEGQYEREQQVRATWKATGGDAIATLKCLPHGESMSRERTILKGLKRFGNDKPLEALQCLQYSIRTFWINSYQSYLWNIAATERIERYGMKVVLGDLFYPSGSCNSEEQSTTLEVKIVEESDLSSVTLEQVVLPLPGYNVQYPAHEIADVYQRLLQFDGIQFDKNAPVEATAKGGYRYLIAKPNDMTVSFCEDEVTNDDKSKATTTTDTLRLSFELPKGSYATMLLRELMVTTATRPTIQSQPPKRM